MKLKWFSLWMCCDGISKEKRNSWTFYIETYMHSPLNFKQWITQDAWHSRLFTDLFFFSLLFFYLSCPRSIYSVSNRFQLILLTVTCITEGSWLFRLAVAFWFSDYNRKQNYILLHNTSSNKRNICNGRNDRLPTVFIQKIFFSLPSQEKLIVMHAYYMLHALTSQ